MAITESIFDDAGATLALIKAWLGGSTADGRSDFETVHDPTTELGADVINKLVAGLAQAAKRLRPGNLVCIPFELTGLSAGATAQAILGGSSDKTVQRMLKDATLVGITAEHSADLTAGTLTVQPQIGGTNTALSLELSDTVQVARAHQIPADAGTADAVDASDTDETIEVDITTDGSFAPTGGDVWGMLWFSVGEEEDL